LGGGSVLLGSLVAYILDKKNSKYAGFPISYGSGLWPWILLASWVSLILSGLLFGGIRVEGDSWIPTFVPYVSVPSAVILIYGGNFVNMITGAVLGALLTTPITLFMRYSMCLPWGLPGVIASVSGMWIGGIIVFEVCNLLPWMVKVPLPARPENAPKEPDAKEKAAKKNSYFIRRMLADYSEPMFVGNEIAGAMLVLGSILTWFLNPMQPYYGTGWFPALLLSQIITGAVALYVYWPTCVATGLPSFVPVVSVAPAMILTFGPSMFVIVFSAILGALLCPVIAIMFNKNIPSHWGGMVGTTFSMAFCSFAVGVLVKFLLMAFPALGVQ
jgi:MFS family permease